MSIFRDWAPAYWSAGFSPLPLQGKRPLVKNWPAYCDNLPKQETRNEWLANHPDANLGIALGKELIEGFSLAAIDVDDGRFAEAARVLIGQPVPTKVGKNGATYIVLVEKTKISKSTALRSASGTHAIDLLMSGKQTVVPPSVHPDSGSPYAWIGKSLLEFTVDTLPRVSWRAIEFLKAIVESREAEVLTRGQGTHEAALTLAAQIVRFSDDDDYLAAVVGALLPPSYAGDTRRELLEMIRSARAKGFASAERLPIDEAAARAVESQLAPLKFSPRDGFLQYQAGRWKSVSLTTVQRRLKEHVLTAGKPGAMVAPVLKAAVTCLALNVEDDSFGEFKGLICLANGTLHVATGTLQAHSPDDRLRFALDIDWDPDATCPTYEGQLAETLKGDVKAMDTFEEFAGLSLVPDLRFQKALFLMGEGGSGKSTRLRTIQMMHDPQAISVTPLDKLDDERYRTDVVGKLICISFDVQTRHRIFGETFIRITGGDAVATRRLFKEVDGLVQPTVRFVGSMNPDMPPYQGAPDALRRRLMFLTCGARIVNPDPDREAKLLSERAGILVRWVKSLQRLYARGGFDIPESSSLEVDDYLIAYEPFDSFSEERLMKDKASSIAVVEVAQIFNNWAELQGERTLSTMVIGRKLKRLGFELGQKRLQRSDGSVNTRVVFARWTRAPVLGSGKF